MALKKCPKCELNYIKEGEQFCNVCMREMKRTLTHGKAEDDEEVVMCTECGEKPALRGSELCADCLKEQKRQVELENANDLDAAYDEAVGDDDPVEEEEE